MCGWIRPIDTGRSTNCLINEVGIHVHKRQRGYHNYALPYSWDVRLGHKKRDAALAELDDRIDQGNVVRILGEVGFDPDASAPARVADRFLVAYYTSADEIPAKELRQWLGERLPQEFLPRSFVRLESLPLTPNGKLDRDALPAVDIGGAESEREFRAPTTELEKTLAAIWSKVLGVERIGTHDSFFELGGDSIHNIQIVARAAKSGLALTPQQIFDYPTISELVTVAVRATKNPVEQGPVEGTSRLTPAQTEFLAENDGAGQRYCQVALLDAHDALEAGVIERAVAALLAHHDALRSRFARVRGAWRQILQPVGAPAFDFGTVDLAELDAPRQDAAIDAAMHELSASLDPESGRVVAARYFQLGATRPARLLLVAHHLVVDGVSWWIILDDLATATRQLRANESPHLPARTSSVRRWADALAARANSPQLRAEKDFWCTSGSDLARLPLDRSDGAANLRASSETVSVSLGAFDTARLLKDVAAAQRAQVPDLLLAALLGTLSQWTGGDRLRFDLEGHGRKDIGDGLDLTRTVGWFTTVYPVRLKHDRGADPVAALRSVKRQLRAVPGNGLGYGILRHLSADSALVAKLRGLPQPEVLFNYMGQWDQAASGSRLFDLARPIVATGGASQARTHLLEINAVVFAGCLRMDWTFSTNLHLRATVEALAQDTIESLVSLLDACLDAPAPALAAEDFAGAGLNQAELDELVADLGESPE